MKILIDGRLISDKETGISRYTEELLKIYIDLFGKENIVLLVNENLKKSYDNIEVIKTSYYPFNIIHFLKFHQFLKNIEFDIYHSMFYANSFFKLKNKVYITTVHDLMYKLLPNFFRKNYFVNKLAIYYFDFIVKKSLKNSDFIISVSKATQNDILNLYKKESIVITEGINELKTKDTTLEIDEKYIKKGDYFLYVGNNRPHKNVDFLKNVYLASSTRKKLIIVGHKGLNVKVDNKEILYTGYINDYTLKKLYENCAAFIFPSLYEGFGLPVLEAINLNAIVLSSNRGALKEFGEYNIHYFDPESKDSLLRLINNVDSFTFDIAKKQELLGKYNWNVVKDQIKTFYREKLNV